MTNWTNWEGKYYFFNSFVATDEDVSWFHKEYSSLWISGAVAAQSAAYGLGNIFVKKIIHSLDLHFDLVINDEYYHESWLMFGPRFKAPIITIAASSKLNLVLDYNLGLITPVSHVSHSILGYGDDMTFSERWANTWFSLASLLYHDQFHLRLQDQIARDHFSTFVSPLPSVRQLVGNVSLTLVNSHAMLWPVRPAMPTLINVGGAHLRTPKPLPKEIKTFIDHALDGVIVVYLEETFDVTEMQIFLGNFFQFQNYLHEYFMFCISKIIFIFQMHLRYWDNAFSGIIKIRLY